MRILAQDPSFRAMAFSYYDGDKTIIVDHSSVSLGDSIGFERVYHAIDEIWEQYEAKLKHYNIRPNELFSEIPPPVGSFSAGLYALDTTIINRLKPYISDCGWVFSASYLSTVHGGNYTKSDSSALAKYLMNEVLGDRFTYILGETTSETGRKMKGRMNNDRAESFLFLMRAFCKYDICGCRDLLMQEVRGFGAVGEHLLFNKGEQV